MVRLDHARHGFTNHDLAKLQRSRIGFSIIHAATDVWVKRQVLDAEQDLPRTRRQDRSFLKAEVAQLRSSVRPGGQYYLACSIIAHVDFSDDRLAPATALNAQGTFIPSDLRGAPIDE